MLALCLASSANLPTKLHIFAFFISDFLKFNPSVAMVFFKTCVAIGGGGGVNEPPDVSRILCHLQIKFQKLYPCFRG